MIIGTGTKKKNYKFKIFFNYMKSYMKALDQCHEIPLGKF
jgi:hypothetical protein